MILNITKKAEYELKMILHGHPNRLIRLGVKAGGCSGFTYTLDTCEIPKSDDEVMQINGIRFVCDSISSIYLDGVTIDFSDELISRGFIFDNPSAKSKCRCGLSFSP
jgi:iron-sulfur cluster assembly protein